MQKPTSFCRLLGWVIWRNWSLEREQITRAINLNLAAFRLNPIKPARGKLTRRAGCADRRTPHITNRFDLIMANGANDVVYVCHAPQMTNFLSYGKTILYDCDKKLGGKI